jgi:hypothetical protein
LGEVCYISIKQLILKTSSGAQVVHPVILATQEAEIRRIVVQSQPEQIVHKTLSQKNPSQKGLMEWFKV